MAIRIENVIIPKEKLTQYLLAPRPKNDKSRFLAQAGFTLKNADALDEAIRRLVAENDAVPDKYNEYGTFYQVVGELHGPEGILSATTIWILRTNDDRYRFVTLKPAR